MMKFIKQHVRWLLPIALVLLIGLGILGRHLRSGNAAQGLVQCTAKKQFERCYSLTKRLIEKQSLTPELETLAIDALRAEAEELEPSRGLELIRQRIEEFPELKEIGGLRTDGELRYLQALAQRQSPSFRSMILQFAQAYGKDPEVLYKAGRIAMSSSPPLPIEAATIFIQAADLRFNISQRQGVADAVLAALRVQPRKTEQSNAALFRMVRNHYIDQFRGDLVGALQNRDEPIFRNNAFHILDVAGQLSEAETFRHHWMNILQGHRQVELDYRESVAFFQNHFPAAEHPESFRPEVLNFSFVPLIDQLPNTSTNQTVAALFHAFPKETEAFFTEQLNTSDNQWRRVNVFRALMERKALSKRAIATYHRKNLKLKAYSHFTDWLTESIDYFGNLGWSGKSELKTFANRVASLKSRAKSAGNKSLSANYREIELYARKKIGRRN